MLPSEPATWSSLYQLPDPGLLTPAGADAHGWAVDVHERYFGPAWPADAAALGDLPFVSLALWPVRSPSTFLRLVERACLLALHEPHWPALRSQAAASPSQAWAHLRLVLETAGWAARAGWDSQPEPRLVSGKRPDLLLTRGRGNAAGPEQGHAGRPTLRATC